ncbi:MAG: hypothetical protein A2X11_04250 [Bacteroidetes bacterium GWE2_42_24]|nr:MAG: hypothetical protein A2X11_04250 [Bacteroidetes bacterium GWE2_42_24]OFY25258.1 MAG: hypothetical protein A2X09_11045 [Bacteroidetes bacterium GWF2_43_11]
MSAENATTRSLILGCMGMGGTWDQNPVTLADETKAASALDAALESGITTFDHADIYSFGKAETVFGRLLATRPSLRQSIHIQSKTGVSLNAGVNGDTHYDLSRKYIVDQTLAILKRLQTDYLDTLLLHRPDPLMEGEEIAAAFEWLHTRGLVRFFGVSNMHLKHIRYITGQSHFPIVANQLQFSLGHRLLIESDILVNQAGVAPTASTDGLLAYCHDQEVVLQAWSPLDKGKYLQTDAEDATTLATILKVKEMAGRYQVPPEAILLAWLFAMPARVVPVVGTLNPSRIKACAMSLNVKLSRTDWYDLWITARGISLP